MFKSLLETIQDGFQSSEEKQTEAELMLAQLVVESEYQSCLMELNSEF